MEVDRKALQKVERNVKEQKRGDAVQQLSRMPGNCPVGNCPDIVFPSNLMMHMLHKHANASSNASAEIYEHRPLTMYFNPTGFEYGQNYCLATLMYGGQMGNPNTQPAMSFLSLPNAELINDYHKYDNYLPIMMMVCHTTWFAQLKDKNLENELVSKVASRAGIYVFWLTSPATTRKLHYTLTIYDKTYSNSRSVIRLVRDYTGVHNPSDFLSNDGNYLLLRDSEVSELMSIGKSSSNTTGKQKEPGLPMELIIYEKPLKSKVRHSSQKQLQVMLAQAQDLYDKQTMPRAKLSIKRGLPGKMSATKKPRPKATGPSAGH